MNVKVFWSWQNDAAPKDHRHIIRDALSDAVATASSELALDDAERPELDHDTKNEAGMVDIAETILRKISEAAVFVADVTPIGSSANGKYLPNPNVLVELGWAMNTPGYRQIITILNLASGAKPDDLPFDIRHRRALTYELSPTADKATRKRVRERLASDLTGALVTNIKAHIHSSAQSVEIAGIQAKESDRSIWHTAPEILTYRST